MENQDGAMRPKNMEKYIFIALAAGIGALAAVVKALHEKAGFWGALLDAALAFVLCAAAATFIMHWTAWPHEVIGGSCGIVGLYSKRLSKWIESIVDAAGKNIKNRVEKFEQK